MDLSYATIPVFGGEFIRLYREVHMSYLVSDSSHPNNHPIYSIDENFGSCILQLNDETEGVLQVQKDIPVQVKKEEPGGLWQMYFDGASSKEGAGVGVLLISAGGEVISLMYKLEFKTTNNITEYEALILGLRAAKDLGIKELAVFGDSELVIQQVKRVYQVKQYLLKVYRNEVWDLIENFFIAFNITFVPREYNETTDSLALAAAYFKVWKVTHLKYPIDVRYKPSVPDNIKHWKVFNDD